MNEENEILTFEMIQLFLGALLDFSVEISSIENQYIVRRFRKDSKVLQISSLNFVVSFDIVAALALQFASLFGMLEYNGVDFPPVDTKRLACYNIIEKNWRKIVHFQIQLVYKYEFRLRRIFLKSKTM